MNEWILKAIAIYLIVGFGLASWALTRSLKDGAGDAYHEVLMAGGAVWLWLPCVIYEWWRWRKQRAWENQRRAEWEARCTASEISSTGA